jgi:predicted ester cyclase
MSEQQEAVGRAVAAFNAGDIGTYMELYDPSVVLHGYAPEPIDFEGAKAFYSMLMAAIPGGQLAGDDILQDGNKVVVRFTLKGKHGGEFLGVPATGKPVVLSGQTILRFDGTKVVERWQTADLLGAMVQIGAIPAPA